MKLEGHQKRLTIFVGESDHVGHVRREAAP
jgi:hypothetical protein